MVGGLSGQFITGGTYRPEVQVLQIAATSGTSSMEYRKPTINPERCLALTARLSPTRILLTAWAAFKGRWNSTLPFPRFFT